MIMNILENDRAVLLELLNKFFNHNLVLALVASHGR